MNIEGRMENCPRPSPQMRFAPFRKCRYVWRESERATSAHLKPITRFDNGRHAWRWVPRLVWRLRLFLTAHPPTGPHDSRRTSLLRKINLVSSAKLERNWTGSTLW